jgi:hypothetical protein
MRYIVTIRKPDQPTTYYLSKRGLRCYDARNVAVFTHELDARGDRDYFAAIMPAFILTVERLPARVRNVSKALLSAVPI